MSETITYLAQFKDWSGTWCDDGNVYASAREARDWCIASLVERGYAGTDVRVLRVTTTQHVEIVGSPLSPAPVVTPSTEGES